MNQNNIDLIEQFTRLEWLFHRYHQLNHTQHGPMGDPRRGQGRVLAILKMKPEISQKELSYLMDMRPQSLGELLSKLEKNGYITRTPSETDRRVMNIKLTKEGAEATGAAEQEFSFDKLFECLNEEEQMNLSSYLGRIIETLEAQLGDEQHEPHFDPRLHGGNPFGGHFGGRPNWMDQSGNTGAGQFDSRFGMEHNHPGHMPFSHHPDGMHFGSRHGMDRENGECPDKPTDKTDED